MSAAKWPFVAPELGAAMTSDVASPGGNMYTGKASVLAADSQQLRPASYIYTLIVFPFVSITSNQHQRNY